VGESKLLLGLDQQRGMGLGQGMSEGSIFGNQNLGNASKLGDLACNSVGSVASDKGGNGSTQLGGGCEGVQG